MPKGKNNFLPYYRRITTSDRIAQLMAADNTIVYCEDFRSHYVMIFNGSAYTIDNDKVFGTALGGDTRWVAVDGPKSYFGQYPYFIFVNTLQSTYTIDALYNQIIVVEQLTGNTTFVVPNVSPEFYSRQLSVFIRNSNGYTYTIETVSAQIILAATSASNIRYTITCMTSQYLLKSNTNDIKINSKLHIGSQDQIVDYNGLSISGGEGRNFNQITVDTILDHHYSHYYCNNTTPITLIITPTAHGKLYYITVLSTAQTVTLQPIGVKINDITQPYTLKSSDSVILYYNSSTNSYYVIAHNAWNFHADGIYSNTRVGVSPNIPPTLQHYFALYGSLGIVPQLVTTNTTLDITHNTVIVRPSAATISITLPSITTCVGRIYTIIFDNSATANPVCTILPTGTDTIEDNTSKVLTSQNEIIILYATTTPTSQWKILTHHKNKQQGTVDIVLNNATGITTYTIPQTLRNRTLSANVTRNYNNYIIQFDATSLDISDEILIEIRKTANNYTVYVYPHAGATINHATGFKITSASGSITIRKVSTTLYMVCGMVGAWTQL